MTDRAAMAARSVMPLAGWQVAARRAAIIRGSQNRWTCAAGRAAASSAGK
jgi:hypothetical protein